MADADHVRVPVSKVAIYGLVGTFVVHLLARGFWVALLGMRSVFPEGVRWDHLSPRIGPVSRELARAEAESLPRVIERVDNVASGTFGFGFILLSTAVSIGLMTVVVVAIATFVSQFVFGGRFAMQTVLALIALVVVPFSIAQLVDRLYGARLAPGGGKRRLLERVLMGWRHVFGTRVYRQMMLVYATNIGWRKATWLVSGTLFVLLSGTLFEIMLRRNLFEPLGTNLVPRIGASVLQRAAYADQRGEKWMYDMTPFIQSDMVSGPYLRLFAPASPRRFPAAIRSDCPGVAMDPIEELEAEAVRRRAVLDCLARLLDVRLDGNSLPDLAFEFTEDAASTLPGLVAYVPIAELPAGRHELTVRRIRGADDEPRPERDTVRIPFWR